MLCEMFTNSLQHKNTNITNFVLALPFKIIQFNKAFKFEM